MMMRLIVAAAVAFGLSTGAFAQVVSVVNPNSVKTLDLDGVVGQCAIVAQSNGSGADAGLCIGATSTFLEAMRRSTPGSLDQTVTDLVLKLVPLAQLDEQCNAIDDEVAQAIRIAATYATTPEQALRLTDIAATIQACDTNATAAIQSSPLAPGGTTLAGSVSPG